ncbi:MAG: peptidylprolyl isomerase [Victivallales bacterium]|nr:peptidylprolyl isomerase [Victivallales bacterium]MCF7888889.1 peptidylprolyl isomerase [Victivallales bacterium]
MKKKMSLLTVVLCTISFVCIAADKPSAAKQSRGKAVQRSVPAMPKMPKLDPKTWDFIPEVVATVGDKKITKEELVKTLTPQVRMLKATGRKIGEEQYKQMAVAMTNDLIKAKVLEELAANAGFKVTPEIEKQTYKKFCEKFKKQLPKGENITFEDIVKKQGLNIKDVKKQLAQAEVVQKWMKEKIEPSVKITKEDAKEFYEENKETFFKKPETVTASHILIKPVFEKDGKKIDKKKAWAEAKAKADKIYKEVKAGKDFAKLAKKNSDGPSSKNGGKLGSFQKGQMVPAFETECWELALEHAGVKGGFNEYGEVKTKFGWHIIDVTGYDPGGYVKLNDKLINQIEEQLKQEKTAEKIKKMVNDKIEELKPVVNLKVSEKSEKAE